MENSSPDDRDARPTLLGATDLPPVQIINPQGPSSFLLVGDHAGAAIPAALGTLGLSPDDLRRHIALDIGIQALGEALSGQLDAMFISQRYSRLVVDCNRATLSHDAMPTVSDGTAIAGNSALTAADRLSRIGEIHAPYQAAIARALAQRDEAGIASILISLHSFTPVMSGVDRPWEIGVLYDAGNTRFAVDVLDALRRESDLVVGDNEPYCMDSTDHTVPFHAFSMNRPYVELEIRQDLIASDGGVARWSERLARVFNAALGAY